MKKQRTTYECTLTPLTPIQIGNGNEIYPYNYVIKDGIYYRIELNEIIDKFPSEIKEDFIRLLENNNMIKIRSFIFDNYKEEYGYLYKAHVEENFEKLYSDKLKGAKSKNEENQFKIEEFIGNHNGKFIPGSTIKGALRNAFLFSEFKDKNGYTLDRNKKIKTAPFILKDINKKYEKKESDGRESKILGLHKLEPKVDPFKNFIVTDTNTVEDLIKIKEVKRVSVKDNKSDMPMGTYEVTKSRYSDNEEPVLNFKIIINEYDIFEDTLNELLKPKKNNNVDFYIVKEKVNLYIKRIFESLNFKAKMILEEDIRFFDKAGEGTGSKICKKMLEKLKTLKENEALIRFGRGAGFNSTTFNLVNNKDIVYTRVVSDDCPVGWAVISYKQKV